MNEHVSLHLMALCQEAGAHPRTHRQLNGSTDDEMDDGTETGLEALRGNLERRGAEYFFAPPFLHLLVLAVLVS